jgi:hypothetical protein
LAELEAQDWREAESGSGEGQQPRDRGTTEGLREEESGSTSATEGPLTIDEGERSAAGAGESAAGAGESAAGTGERARESAAVGTGEGSEIPDLPHLLNMMRYYRLSPSSTPPASTCLWLGRHIVNRGAPPEIWGILGISDSERVRMLALVDRYGRRWQPGEEVREEGEEREEGAAGSGEGRESAAAAGGSAAGLGDVPILQRFGARYEAEVDREESPFVVPMVRQEMIPPVVRNLDESSLDSDSGSDIGERDLLSFVSLVPWIMLLFFGNRVEGWVNKPAEKETDLWRSINVDSIGGMGGVL